MSLSKRITILFIISILLGLVSGLLKNLYEIEAGSFMDSFLGGGLVGGGIVIGIIVTNRYAIKKKD